MSVSFHLQALSARNAVLLSSIVKTIEHSEVQRNHYTSILKVK